jgi:hypothetical protein
MATTITWSVFTVQRNLLHVDARHARNRVAHDAVNGVLVTNSLGPGTERVAQGVEADSPAFQARFGQESPKPYP